MKCFACTLTALAVLTTRADAVVFEASFAANRDYAIISPRGVVTGDFNGDAKPDVAIASSYDHSVTVMLNVKGGAVRRASVAYPSGLAVGDFNGDSRLDMAVTSSGEDTVSVLLGNGDGTFQPALVFPAGGTTSGSIAVTDLNGDGSADVVISNFPTGAALLGNGDGTLRAASPLPFPDYPASIAVGDFTNDGRVDVAAAFGLNLLAVLPGKGDGTFLPPISTATDQATFWIVAGDFNDDGTLDLAADVGDRGGVLLGAGDGTFQPPAIAPSGRYPVPLAVSDFNNDSHVDLLVATEINRDLQVLLGVGDGHLRDSAHVLADSPTAAAVADLNGDAVADIVVVGSETYPSPVGAVAMRIGKGDGSFAPTPGLRTGHDMTAVTTADFNGDGLADVATATCATPCPTPDNNKGHIAILLGNGNGTFRPSPTIVSIPAMPNALAAADFDGDSYQDLAIAGRFAHGIYLFDGRGDGSFGNGRVITNVGNPLVVVARDLNGDSRPDLVVVATTGVSVCVGNGDGTFKARFALNGGGTAPYDVAVADFNGDGALDLGVANNFSKDVSVALGNGDGTFQPSLNSPMGMPLTSLTAADFDGNGDMDVAVTTSDDVRVLFGNGDGLFQPAVRYVTPAPPRLIRAADVNGDKQTDLAVLCEMSRVVLGGFGVGGTLAILGGNGDGTFRLQATGFSTLSPAQIETHSPAGKMAFGDFTSDGRVDIAVAGDGRPATSADAIGLALLYNTTR